MKRFEAKYCRIIGAVAALVALCPMIVPVAARADGSKSEKKIVVVVGPVTKTQSVPGHK
jgi:hypothetical protein